MFFLKKPSLVFILLFQVELDELATIWSGHLIRATREEHSLHGRPYCLYNIPQLYGSQDYKYNVPELKIEACKQECVFKTNIPCDPDFYDLCNMFMDENDWEFPQSADEACELYLNLKYCAGACISE